MAGRRHPKSEVRGGSQEETPRVQGQEWPGEATSHLAPEARGGDLEEPPRARGQGQQLGGATHARGKGQRPGGASRGAVAAQAQEGLEELSHIEDQERRW